MPEHTPAPTPSRGIYGFVIYLIFATLFILYFLWAFIPLSFYEDILGITELPNKYFALFIPLLVLTATTLFAFCIYPSIGFLMTPNIDSINTITDSSSIRRCQFRDSNGILCDNKIQQLQTWDVPRVCESHQNRESKIVNFCDCTDKTKCLLATDRSHIEQLRKQEKFIQNSADMEIYEVTQMLYGE